MDLPLFTRVLESLFNNKFLHPKLIIYVLTESIDDDDVLSCIGCTILVAFSVIL